MTVADMLDFAGAARSGAVFSKDRRYRYALWREWDPSLPQFIVIGLNPSTADETQDDPTIRRCIAFAKREGCGKLVMLNLFAFRATQPKEMFAATDPEGEFADATMRGYAADPRTSHVVAAWGAHGTPERAAAVAALFPELQCFGRTRNGSPRHPLYLAANASLHPYRRGRVVAAPPRMSSEADRG